ncbi:MAG TPA: 16S rRNA (cytosine(1402)-N(4))-methyltransferase RsmH [Chthoniobacterales bacterium]|nr:16S rRNA (cytosine(1402)-N(4))-methyltransferase RsmH [Chthoniobacterales bacterium]
MIALSNERKRESEERYQQYHRPVLLREVVNYFRPGPDKIFLDGTIGGGGHARALLEAGARVIGVDQDPDAISESMSLLADFAERLTLIRSNFVDIRRYLKEMGMSEFDGVLIDLGISSHQLDSPKRGFSFQQTGPLDMRMGPGIPRKASDLVNFAPEAELTRIFRDYGEEPAARKVAAEIVRTRVAHPFSTTTELAQAVETVLPRRGPRHPATRIFQALRIAVNDELGTIERALPILAEQVKPGGRFAVITFHSLEDRLVKQFFRKVTQEWIDRPEWPGPKPNPSFGFRSITSRPVEPSEQELADNPRSRSAKLRVIERNPL